jgi:hypothetical protein
MERILIQDFRYLSHMEKYSKRRIVANDMEFGDWVFNPLSLSIWRDNGLRNSSPKVTTISKNKVRRKSAKNLALILPVPSKPGRCSWVKKH